MPQYYSTFPAGFEPAIEEFIKSDLPGTQIQRVLEGAVEYRRNTVLRDSPRWFNNSFLCLTTFPRAVKDPIQDMVRLTLQRGVDTDVIARHLPDGATTCRAMFMVDGLLAHVGDRTLMKTEEFLSSNSALRIDRARPDVEFWFLYRKEGLGFLLMRLTRHRDFARELAPGELRPDVATLLCRLSNPKPGDVFLDPFAGHGGIIKARTHFPAEQIIAGDKDSKLSAELSAACAPHKKARALVLDALDMPSIDSGSVDAIVTDPPWGDHEPLPDPAGFYGRFCAEARRVLKRDGRLVVLSALKREAEAALRQGFALDRKLDVLISGKKAAVFVARCMK